MISWICTAFTVLYRVLHLAFLAGVALGLFAMAGSIRSYSVLVPTIQQAGTDMNEAKEKWDTSNSRMKEGIETLKKSFMFREGEQRR